MLKKVSLLVVLVLVLLAGMVMVAQAADGSAAWPSAAATVSVPDFSDVVGGEWGLYPGEVTPHWPSW